MADISDTFGWSRWPFRIVADAEFARVWADRGALKTELEFRLRRLRSISHSTIQLLWADFGAGKSHTLRYFQARCNDEGSPAFIPIYTEVPVGPIGLLDLYRAFTANLSNELLETLSKAGQKGISRQPPSSAARDLRQALKVMVQVQGQSLALDWIRAPAGFPNLRDLKAFGISARVDDDLRAVEVLSELVALILDVYPNGAVVWLIDEFQRISDIPQRRRDGFAKSIVSLFNTCPQGLHLVLSFSVAQQSTALALLPPDLKSRAATFPLLALPHLSSDDAIVFCQDLFASFRTTPRDQRDFPFTSDALKHIVKNVHEVSSGALTPRILMDRVDSILFEAYDKYGAKLELPISEKTAVDLVSTVQQHDV